MNSMAQKVSIKSDDVIGIRSTGERKIKAFLFNDPTFLLFFTRLKKAKNRNEQLDIN
jgi:hypothetical protein